MAVDWLEHRSPRAPERLRERMVRDLRAVSPAAGGAGGDPVSEGPGSHLGAAGMAALGRAMSVGGTERDVAMDLLAADGLLTYACEASAEGTDPRAGIDAVLSLFRDPVPS